MVKLFSLLSVHYIKTLLLFTVLASAFNSHHAFALTQVSASIDKNPVTINESILLTVIADDDVSRNALDTSALLNDFIVGRTSVSSHTNMVNFKTTKMTQWQIVIIARKTGNLTIPSLSIDGKNSAPINIEVLEKSDTSAEQQDIFITTELSKNNVYVQEVFTLTRKLHFSVELKSGNLTEPALANATIEKVGEDQQTDTIINGKRYRVIEQTYAITPQESGDFTMEAAVFSGEIMTASRRRSSFLSFAETKPINIVGEAIELSVRPIPLSYPAQTPWLPTEILTLHQEWPSTSTQFTVGEPITRTITLTAAGLSKAQLPEIKMDDSTGLKVYPDQAQLHTNLTKDRLVSQKVQNFALVPSQPGDFTLPEVKITWFNTITNKINYATLPAQTITVEPSADMLANTSPVSTQKDITRANQNSVRAPLDSTTNESNQGQQLKTNTQSNILQWVFLSLWLLSLICWFLHVRVLKKTQPSKNNQHSTVSNNNLHADKKLVLACQHNNAAEALSLVVPWVNQLISRGKITPENGQDKVTNIAKVPALINAQDFATALHDLQQHLYGRSAIDGATSWQGKALENAINQINKKPSKTVSSTSWQLNP